MLLLLLLLLEFANRWSFAPPLYLCFCHTVGASGLQVRVQIPRIHSLAGYEVPGTRTRTLST